MIQGAFGMGLRSAVLVLAFLAIRLDGAGQITWQDCPQCVIQIFVTVDSCLDPGKMEGPADGAVHAPVGMTVRIRNHSGEDYAFALESFQRFAGLRGENGEKAVFLAQEPWPRIIADKPIYIIGDGETRSIHFASSIFWEYDIKPNVGYKAKLEYSQKKGGKFKSAAFLKGRMESEEFEFRVCN